jgi:hypothetical protein
VGGVFGVQVLRSFELDVDVAGNHLAVHPAGHVELGLVDVSGLAAVPCRFTKSEWRNALCCVASGLSHLFFLQACRLAFCEVFAL